MKCLIIDNHDSFTLNLYNYLAQLSGENPIVVPNDGLRLEDVLASAGLDCIVISPGPGRPERERDFGVCRDVLLHASVPILGVCLGHQGIVDVFGGRVVAADEPMHGRTSKIWHKGTGLFAGIPTPFPAVRYHSLLAARPLPAILEEIAWTDSRELMAVRHRHRPIWGVQFHPESICTEHGFALLRNFLAVAQKRATGREAQRSVSVETRITRPIAGRTRQPAAGGPELRTRRIGGWVDCEVAFSTLFGDNETAYWLDSSLAEPGLSRFSFMGDASGPDARVVTYDTRADHVEERSQSGVRVVPGSIFDFLARDLSVATERGGDLPFDFQGGWVGYFGYELKRHCGAEAPHESETPDAAWIYSDRFVAFDHGERAVHLVALGDRARRAETEAWFETTEAALLAIADEKAPELAFGPGAVRVQPTHSDEEYLDRIRRCQELIREGESYQICLTGRFACRIEVASLDLYRLLRRSNPAPYAAFLRFGDLAVLSSSPERFLKLDVQGNAETKPIKGTASRGATPREDADAAVALLESEKDRSENLMIVDLMRNDLAGVCVPGSVHVPHLMHVESFETVHQLVSTVLGRLREGMGAVDCVRALFPGGSMTGAPKRRTMEIIDELEGCARGPYSGALGFLAVNGSADLSIVIRTIVKQGDSLRLGAGGAIVALSDPEAELDEVRLKLDASLRAVGAAQRLRLEKAPELAHAVGRSATRHTSRASTPHLPEESMGPWDPSKTS